MKEGTPKSATVSIILPTFNRSHCIQRAIESIYDQTCKQTELIIVDDASTDNTVKIINELTISPPIKTTLFVLSRNIGPSAARNYGISQANGEFITFIDSDSVYHPNKIELQVACLEGSTDDIGGCFCRYRHIHEQIVRVIPDERADYFEERLPGILLEKNFIGTPSFMVKKSVFDKLGYFDEGLKCLEDWDLALKVSKNYRVLFLDSVLFDDFYSKNSVNYNNKLKREARELIIDRNSDIWPLNPGAVTYQLKRIAVDLIRDGETKRAQRRLQEAYKIAPTFRKKIKYFFLFSVSRFKAFHFLFR